MTYILLTHYTVCVFTFSLWLLLYCPISDVLCNDLAVWQHKDCSFSMVSKIMLNCIPWVCLANNLLCFMTTFLMPNMPLIVNTFCNSFSIPSTTHWSCAHLMAHIHTSFTLTHTLIFYICTVRHFYSISFAFVCSKSLASLFLWSGLHLLYFPWVLQASCVLTIYMCWNTVQYVTVSLWLVSILGQFVPSDIANGMAMSINVAFLRGGYNSRERWINHWNIVAAFMK